MDFNTFVAMNQTAFDQLHKAIGETLDAYTHEERMKLRFLTVMADNKGQGNQCLDNEETRTAA